MQATDPGHACCQRCPSRRKHSELQQSVQQRCLCSRAPSNSGRARPLLLQGPLTGSLQQRWLQDSGVRAATCAQLGCSGRPRPGAAPALWGCWAACTDLRWLHLSSPSLGEPVGSTGSRCQPGREHSSQTKLAPPFQGTAGPCWALPGPTLWAPSTEPQPPHGPLESPRVPRAPPLGVAGTGGGLIPLSCPKSGSCMAQEVAAAGGRQRPDSRWGPASGPGWPLRVGTGSQAASWLSCWR